MKTCTLVLQYVDGASFEAGGAVWIGIGDRSRDLEGDDEISEQTGWCRVISGIDYEEASSIHARLKDFFVSAGVEVVDEGVAE